MDLNPYAPPNSAVVDVHETDASEESAPVFFAVSRSKLLVMSFCTIGLYPYFWFYKNWKIIRDRTQEDISPFWRTFFGIFFCHALFDSVRKYDSKSSAANLHSGPLAAVWIISVFLLKLPVPYKILGWLSILALLPVQTAINDINRIAAPNHNRNSRFTAWNWVGIAIGGPLFLLVVLSNLYAFLKLTAH